METTRRFILDAGKAVQVDERLRQDLRSIVEMRSEAFDWETHEWFVLTRPTDSPTLTVVGSRVKTISLTLALSALGTVGAHPAPSPGAASSAERVRITYVAAPTCPGQDTLEMRVGERVGRPWKATGDELARTLHAAVVLEGERWMGSLDFTDAAGRHVSRMVDAESCEQAVSALALVTALAIESLLPSLAPTAESSPLPSASASSLAGTAPEPSIVSPPLQSATAVSGASTAAPNAEARATGSRRRGLIHEWGLRAGFAYGLGPHAAWNGGVFWGLGKADAWPLVRLGVDGYDTGEQFVASAGGHARFRVLAGRSLFCPLPLAIGRSWGIPACAGLEAGSLWARGRGSHSTSSSPQNVPWAAGLLWLGLRWQRSWFVAEFVAEARFALLEVDFLFRPNVSVYRVPRVALGTAAGMGVRFP